MAISEETRKKLSDALRARWADPKTRPALLANVRKLTMSPEHRKKMAEVHRGVPKTEQQKEKMRQAKLGTTQSPEHNQKRMISRRITLMMKKLLEPKYQNMSWSTRSVQGRANIARMLSQKVRVMIEQGLNEQTRLTAANYLDFIEYLTEGTLPHDHNIKNTSLTNTIIRRSDRVVQRLCDSDNDIDEQLDDTNS